MFKLLRYFSVASFVAILAALIVLVWFYRQVAIEGISLLAERGNQALAQTALNSMKHMVIDYLQKTEDLQPWHRERPLPPDNLASALQNLMKDTVVVRIKLFNRHGMVVYSNQYGQVGSDQRHNAGFHTAILGKPTNSLVPRDSFNHLDGSVEHDNLMQTYLPVQAEPNAPIMGVFEIYTDVNHLAMQTERTEFIILSGALLILSIMYAAVVLIVWRAGKIIDMQQATIRERTSTLEVLSAHMLRNEESHKKKIAFDLHEGLAQTLSAIKVQIENLKHGGARDEVDERSIGTIIPVLQDAINEVRSIAGELRPSSIDDFGLVFTMELLCHEMESQHPAIKVKQRITVQEKDIPSQLKIILYRIIIAVLDDMAKQPGLEQIEIALWYKDRILNLMIEGTADETIDDLAAPLPNIEPQLSPGFSRMEELATLSGGTFQASHHPGRGMTLHAFWRT